MFFGMKSNHLARSILLEESGNPLVFRLVIGFFAVVVAGFLAWAAVARIDEVAVAPGEIVPTSHNQEVQHLDGGLIAAIRVRDGDSVAKGQVIMVLDTVQLGSQLDEARAQHAMLRGQQARLTALIDGATLAPAPPGRGTLAVFEQVLATRQLARDLVQEQIAQLEAKLEELVVRQSTLEEQRRIVGELMTIKTTLHDRGLGSRINVLDMARQMAEIGGELLQTPARRAALAHQIAEAGRRLAKVDADAREAALLELEKVETALAANDEAIRRLEDRIRQSEIRAPASGIVLGLKVYTVGSVLARGTTVAEIVPDDQELIAELRITPQDIGHVRTDQPVNLRLAAFDFARYGGIPGTLTGISPSTVPDRTGAPYYKGTARLHKLHVGADPLVNRVLPGMTVQGDIRTGNKTVLEYLLKPIFASGRQALRER